VLKLIGELGTSKEVEPPQRMLQQGVTNIRAAKQPTGSGHEPNPLDDLSLHIARTTPIGSEDDFIELSDDERVKEVIADSEESPDTVRKRFKRHGEAKEYKQHNLKPLEARDPRTD
jgi:hypothetical protein